MADILSQRFEVAPFEYVKEIDYNLSVILTSEPQKDENSTLTHCLKIFISNNYDKRRKEFTARFDSIDSSIIESSRKNPPPIRPSPIDRALLQNHGANLPDSVIQYQKFNHLFEKAESNYGEEDYEKTIEILLEPVKTLEAKGIDKQYLREEYEQLFWSNFQIGNAHEAQKYCLE